MLLVCLVVLAAAPVSDEAWVRGWLGGRSAPPAMMTGFHQAYPSSPHAPSSFAYEAATRVRKLVDLPKTRDALATAAVRVMIDPKESPEAVRRASRLLRWLSSSQVVEQLVDASRAPSAPATRSAAMEALGGYGTDENRDAFIVFGGNLAMVTFPPRPDERAGAALLALLHDPEPYLRRGALEALEAFHGPQVDAELVAALADQENADKVLELVAKRQLKDAVPRVRERVVAGGPARLRARAIETAVALGDGAWLRPTLMTALDDADEDVFLAAHRALWAMEGLPGVPPDTSTLDRALLSEGWKKRLAH